jgi:hypothetical protein
MIAGCTRSVPLGAAPAFKVQPPPAMSRLPTFAQVALLVAVAATVGSGCRREIGDDCRTAVDCQPNGSRQCDSSQPGGYCTIQGCDERSCPEEAVCMRFFPGQFLTKPCNPGEDNCAADEICLEEGLCAPLSTELRFCVKSCSSADDCRDGYACRLAGTRGSQALTPNIDTVVSFCAPQ